MTHYKDNRYISERYPYMMFKYQYQEVAYAVMRVLKRLENEDIQSEDIK